MAEQTVVEAAPSAATEAQPTFEIPRSGTEEYATWRKTGALPETSKTQPEPAESAPADAPKETNSENPPEPESGKQKQENRRRPDVEERFKKLTDELKATRAELEEVRRAKTTQAEPSPAKPSEPTQPQTYQAWRKAFKPSQWVEGYIKENPEASYEDAYAAMSDHLGDVRDHFRAIDQQRQAMMNDVSAKVNEARARYENFDEVAKPFATKLTADPAIPVVVKEMVNDSPVFADLVFTLAGDADFMALAQNEPQKAIRYIAKVETLIGEELGKGAVSNGSRNDKGQFTAKEETPAKRGPESAPEPPLEIGSRGSGPMDESERALSAIQRGDPKAVRDWLNAENAKELRRRKGM